MLQERKRDNLLKSCVLIYLCQQAPHSQNQPTQSHFLKCEIQALQPSPINYTFIIHRRQCCDIWRHTIKKIPVHQSLQEATAITIKRPSERQMKTWHNINSTQVWTIKLLQLVSNGHGIQTSYKANKSTHTDYHVYFTRVKSTKGIISQFCVCTSNVLMAGKWTVTPALIRRKPDHCLFCLPTVPAHWLHSVHYNSAVRKKNCTKLQQPTKHRLEIWSWTIVY